MNPAVSAFEQLHGQHNYDSHLFSILGSAVRVHVTPKNRRTWAEHTVPGFYLGLSWEHYRCQDVWVSATTTTDALIHTGQELCAKLRGKTPDSPLTKKAVENLMNIFKSAADTQRVRKSVAMAMQKETEKQGAAAQRVPASEDEEFVGTISTPMLTDDKESVVSAKDLTHEAPLEEDIGLRMTGLEVTYPSQKDRPACSIVSHDDDGPSQQMRSKTNALLAAIELSGSCPTVRQAAAWAYRLQFLTDFAGAMVDDKSEKFLEYRHLTQWPKYRKD